MIDRGSHPYPISIEIYVNNILFTTSTGDGFIFATPSGSTAYAM